MRGRQFVEHMAAAFEQLGFPRMPARVLFTMMVADEPGLTAAELAHRLDVSPAAISGALKTLGLYGMLVREPVIGSRRDRYRLPDHAWYTASFQKGNAYRQLAKLADDGLGELEAGTAAAERATEMRDFFLFLANEIEGLMHRWEKYRGDHPATGSS